MEASVTDLDRAGVLVAERARIGAAIPAGHVLSPRFRRASKAADKALGRLWVHERAPVVKSCRRHLERIDVDAARAWAARQMEAIEARDRRWREIIVIQAKAVRRIPQRAKPALPPVPMQTFAYDSVKAQARVMRWSERQTRAAETFFASWSELESPGTGTLDMDRVGGGGAPGRPPPEHRLVAGEVINEAQNTLGRFRFSLLVLVVGHGMTLREVSRKSDPHAKREEIEATGAIVRDALSALADRWHIGSAGNGRIRSSGHAALVPEDMPDHYETERAKVHHAGYPKAKH